MNEANTATSRSPVYADLGRKAVNFFGFDTVWLITVLGAARGLTWPGLVALAVFAAMHARLFIHPRADFLLMGIMCTIGLLFDSALVRSGLLDVTTSWPSPGIAPLWMIVLWANMALAINHCLGWLHGRYALAAVFGAIGGPLAYLGGAALGAGEFTVDTLAITGAIALFWAVITPLLFGLGAALQRAESGKVSGQP